MPYHQLYYHLVSSTQNRQPLLTSQTEPAIYDFLRAKAVGREATLFALNGTVDHVHLVVSIPPKIAVARFIGQVKAVASAKFNKSRPGDPPFFWQDEYGAFSFDAKRLPNYIAYVNRQKEHHAQGTTIPVLERTDDQGPRIMHETETFYTAEETGWRCELEALFGDSSV
jgi:REP element-mobilizing transposase RayT